MTEALSLKTMAVSMLMSFAEDLRGLFYPHLQQCLSITIPLMTHPHKDCRSYAILAQPSYLKALVHAAQTNQCSREALLQAADYILTQITLHMESEVNTELKHQLVGTLSGCIEILAESAEGKHDVAELLSGDDMERLTVSLMQLLRQSFGVIDARDAARAKERFMDEEESRRIDKQNARNDELHIEICDALDNLMKVFGTAFFAMWEKIWPEFQSMLQPGRSPNTQKAALFVVDSVVEVFGGDCRQYLPDFVEYIVNYTQHEDPRVRQAAAYGVRVMAEHLPEQDMLPYVEVCVEKCLGALGEPQAREDAWSSATDNVIVAIGALAKTHRPDLWPVWTAALPLQVDMGEGPHTYGTLMENFHAENPGVLGENMALMPTILNTILEVVGDLDWLGDPQTQMSMFAAIPQILKVMELQGKNPQEFLNETKMEMLNDISEQLSEMGEME
jgi:hypothetical protein